MFKDAPQGETQYELTESEGPVALLGGGADLTGRLVEYWGDVWTIADKNYIGDWDVERRETRATGAVKITSSISAVILPESHPHFACLVPAN